MITPIEGTPVKFNNTSNECDTFDERTYCQMVEQTDRLNFAWEAEEISDNLVTCHTFANEDCLTGYDPDGEGGADPIPAEWEIGGWTLGGILYSLEGESVICIDEENNTATQLDVFETAGYYKVIVKIPAYPYSQNYQGTFTVTAGDAVSASTAVAAGTHTFYLNVTTPGDLVLTFTDATVCLDEVTAYQLCDSYSVNVYTKDGTYIKTVTDNISNSNGVYYYSSYWSALDLDDGCYYLCLIKTCESNNIEIVLNGDLSSSIGWTFGGTWSYDAVNDEADHSVGSTTTCRPTLLYSIRGNTPYLLQYDAKNMLGGDVTAYLGGLSGVEGQNTSGEATVVELLTTGSSPVQSLLFSPSSDMDGTIDNVSLKEAEASCTTCFDLRETHPCTKLLSWTNDNDGFGIPYFSIDFTNYLRVNALLEKPRYPQEVDRFMFSNGSRKILFANGEKISSLFLDYLPEYLHDAIANGKMHDHFYIDGEEYICSSDEYQPEWRNRLKLAQSKIEVQKKIDLNKNTNC